MFNKRRLATLSTLEEIAVEKRRVKHELKLQEVEVAETFRGVINSFSFFSSFTSFIRSFSSSLTLINGMKLGFKLFSLFFRK